MNFNQKVVDMRESITDYFNLLREEDRYICKGISFGRYTWKRHKFSYDYTKSSEYEDFQKSQDLIVKKLSNIADLKVV